MSKDHWIGIALTASLLTVGPSAAQPTHDGQPKAKVDLISSVDGIAPAVPFDIGLRFKLVRPWHIYWQNSGESGQPPKINWKLPPGFTAGAFQFPVPKRHTDPSGYMTTNILEHDPILLVTVTPPPVLSGTEVTIAGDLKYLICDELCLQEKAKVSLTLPIRQAATEVRPIHQDLFSKARDALPTTESEHVSIRAEVTPPPSEIEPGDTFDLLVYVDIVPGRYLPTNRPENKALTPTDLFVEHIEGVFWDPPDFDAGSARRLGS
ncbi:MAG: protein-disulfide reductase DsbD family protein, partial [Kiloniellales bacterium]|nr:protein-disulfide reductase DsbD family protein [Kiloniellales bacterium]